MSRLKAAFRATLVEYFKKTSLNGFGLLYFIRRRRYQRFFWFLFIAVGILFATFVVFTTLLQFLTRPTVVSLSALNAAEDTIAFPTLTICSVNKLSLAKVELLAKNLSELKGNSTSYWLKELRLLAGYFYPSLVAPQDATRLQTAVAELWPKDVRQQLLQLSPSCESLMLNCIVDEALHNCSHLFQLTPTIEGCCCILQHPEHITNSLTMQLNAATDDYFHMPRLSLAAGFSLHLPKWLGRLSLSPGDVVNLQAHPIRFMADADLSSYPLDERGCHFEHEAEHLVQCLPFCRLRGLLSACNCAPFYYEMSEFKPLSYSYCNLSRTACVQRFEASWTPWNCGECLPPCNDWRYELHKSLVGRLPPNKSTVNIRLSGQRVPIYRQDGLYSWYELLANVGGVLSVCIGCSFISGFEIVYFMVYRLWHNWRQLTM